jgi:hypothetical protein
MPLTIPQLQVASDTHRFRVLISGRRFGKTTLAMREIAKYARFPEQTVWYVAPSYRQAKSVLWNKLKKKMTSLNWAKKINESELSITLVNGSVIALKGADNYDSLRGSGINFLVLDEVADIHPEAWYETLRPTLSDTGGHALFCGTPKGRQNFAYDLFNKQYESKDWISYQYTTLQGGQVPPEEVEAARLDLDERTFQQEYEATFTSYHGVVYHSFDREHNVKPVPFDLKTQLPEVLYTGWDFNIDPMSVVVGYKTPDDCLHIFDEIRIFGSNTEEAIQEFRNRYGNRKTFAMPDPAARQRKTSAGGNTDLTLLANAGFVVKAPHSHEAVRDRINAVNARFCNSKGERRLFIDPRCRYLIESLERQVYKEGTTTPDKDGGWDHLNDSLGYLTSYLYPLKKEYEAQPIQRWTHRTGA